jgi:hypothetical protein
MALAINRISILSLMAISIKLRSVTLTSMDSKRTGASKIHRMIVIKEIFKIHAHSLGVCVQFCPIVKRIAWIIFGMAGVWSMVRAFEPSVEGIECPSFAMTKAFVIGAESFDSPICRRPRKMIVPVSVV